MSVPVILRPEAECDVRMIRIADHFDETSPVSHFEHAQSFSGPCGGNLTMWWMDCPQGDWMLWLAGKLGADARDLVLAAIECAKASLRFLPAGENRPGEALEVAVRWTQDRANASECSNVADRLHEECKFGESMEYGLAAAALTAVGAVEAAVNSAGQSDHRDLCVTLASHAARRAAMAAGFANGDEGLISAHLECARIVRNRIPVDSLRA